MKIIRTVRELEDYCGKQRSAGARLGLVPTMGALHAGHLSLVKRAVDECDKVVASVFVNPTQFNNPEDLASYPRDEKADFDLLESNGVDAVFAPDAAEIYPAGAAPDKEYDLGSAAEVMEGKYRPGHFQGVAQIVSRLFRFTGADRAYFGQKDFQQIAVVRNMTRSEGIDIEIVSCPILRDADGLALSSRNALLSPAQRAVAPGIYKVLAGSVDFSRTHSVEETRRHVIESIDSLPECRTEYFDIVDADTLLPVSDWADADRVQGCITVYCGKVRLIDNIAYKK